MADTGKDDLVWPLLFNETTQDQSGAAHLSTQDQLPWVVGVDGRLRGGLHSYEGHVQYGSLMLVSPRDVGIIQILDSKNIANNSTLTIGDASHGQVITFVTGTPSTNQVQVGGTRTIYQVTSAIAAILTANTSYFQSVTNSWHTPYGGSNQTYGLGFVRFLPSATLHSYWDTGPIYAPCPFTTTAATACIRLTGEGRLWWTARYLPTGLAGAVTWVAPLEIQKTANTFYRGFLVRIGDELYYYYKDGFGGAAFTEFIHIATGVSALKLGASGTGRVAYVVGTNGTTGIAKTIHYHERYDMVMAADMGPGGILYDTFLPSATNCTSANDATGLLESGQRLYAYRFYDSIRKRFSDLIGGENTNNWGLLGIPATPLHYDQLVTTGPYTNSGSTTFFHALAEDYDTIILYSTISGGTDPYDNLAPAGGFLFKRSEQDLTISTLVYGWLNEVRAGATAGASGGYPYDQLSDLALVMQERYDPNYDYVSPTLPQMEDIAYYQGSSFALVPASGFINIQWSPLDHIEPENFPPLNMYQTRIRAGGMAHFVETGDYLWVLGDGESYRIQKQGRAISIFRKLDGYSFVGPQASCAFGSSVVAVHASGVVIINSSTGTAEQISACDRIILRRWSNNLFPYNDGTHNPMDRVFVATDAQLGAIYIWNRAVGECLVLWTGSNRITMLVDCFYLWLLTSYVPNSRSGGGRAFFMSFDQGSTGSVLAGIADAAGLNLLYPVPGQTTYPNMMGAGSIPLIGTVSAVRNDQHVGAVYYTMVTVTFPSAPTILDGDLAGSVIYNLGTAANLETSRDARFLILANAESLPAKTVQLYILGTTAGTTLAVGNYVSIAPVVMGVVGTALASPLYAGDCMSRRVADGIAAVVGSGSAVTQPTLGLLTYGLCRFTGVGGETVLAAQDDLMEDRLADATAYACPGGVPWSSPTTVVAGVSSTSASPSAIYSTPGQKGMCEELMLDGGIVFPNFYSVLSGQRLQILGLFVSGRVEANETIAAGGLI